MLERKCTVLITTMIYNSIFFFFVKVHVKYNINVLPDKAKLIWLIKHLPENYKKIAVK